MNLEELLKYSKIIGTIILLGGLLWGLSSKFNDSEIRDKELLMEIRILKTGQDILMEERMAKMERKE